MPESGPNDDALMSDPLICPTCRVEMTNPPLCQRCGEVVYRPVQCIRRAMLLYMDLFTDTVQECRTFMEQVIPLLRDRVMDQLEEVEHVLLPRLDPYRDSEALYAQYLDRVADAVVAMERRIDSMCDVALNYHKEMSTLMSQHRNIADSLDVAGGCERALEWLKRARQARTKDQLLLEICDRAADVVDWDIPALPSWVASSPVSEDGSTTSNNGVNIESYHRTRTSEEEHRNIGTVTSEPGDTVSGGILGRTVHYPTRDRSTSFPMNMSALPPPPASWLTAPSAGNRDDAMLNHEEHRPLNTLHNVPANRSKLHLDIPLPSTSYSIPFCSNDEVPMQEETKERRPSKIKTDSSGSRRVNAPAFDPMVQFSLPPPQLPSPSRMIPTASNHHRHVMPIPEEDTELCSIEELKNEILGIKKPPSSPIDYCMLHFNIPSIPQPSLWPTSAVASNHGDQMRRLEDSINQSSITDQIYETISPESTAKVQEVENKQEKVEVEDNENNENKDTEEKDKKDDEDEDNEEKKEGDKKDDEEDDKEEKKEDDKKDDGKDDKEEKKEDDKKDDEEEDKEEKKQEDQEKEKEEDEKEKGEDNDMDGDDEEENEDKEKNMEDDEQDKEQKKHHERQQNDDYDEAAKNEEEAKKNKIFYGESKTRQDGHCVSHSSSTDEDDEFIAIAFNAEPDLPHSPPTLPFPPPLSVIHRVTSDILNSSKVRWTANAASTAVDDAAGREGTSGRHWRRHPFAAPAAALNGRSRSNRMTPEARQNLTRTIGELKDGIARRQGKAPPSSKTLLIDCNSDRHTEHIRQTNEMEYVQTMSRVQCLLMGDRTAPLSGSTDPVYRGVTDSASRRRTTSDEDIVIVDGEAYVFPKSSSSTAGRYQDDDAANNLLLLANARTGQIPDAAASNDFDPSTNDVLVRIAQLSENELAKLAEELGLEEYDKAPHA